MKFKTHNDGNVNLGGTSLQGEIICPYSKLVELFGEPTTGDEYKIDAEWELEFEDGTIATIYNWKSGKNYLGKHGTPTVHITEWHIGGNSERAVELVKLILAEAK